METRWFTFCRKWGVLRFGRLCVAWVDIWALMERSFDGHGNPTPTYGFEVSWERANGNHIAIFSTW